MGTPGSLPKVANTFLLSRGLNPTLKVSSLRKSLRMEGKSAGILPPRSSLPLVANKFEEMRWFALKRRWICNPSQLFKQIHLIFSNPQWWGTSLEAKSEQDKKFASPPTVANVLAPGGSEHLGECLWVCFGKPKGIR